MEPKREGVTFDYDAELCRYQERLRPAFGVGPDDDVLDIGCGTGLTTREAAGAAVRGSALGLDLSASMLATARRLSEQAGLRNVRFEQADAQHHPAGGFSLGISRFGTMFFTDPQAAFANIARALRPGARLVQLVWQAEEHQEWLTVIRDALAGGGIPVMPGAAAPFSLADPAAAARLLTAAGFTDVQASDVSEPVYYGADTETAVTAVRQLWMTPELLGDRDPAHAENALQRLRAAIAMHYQADGVWFDSRAWIITARRR